MVKRKYLILLFSVSRLDVSSPMTINLETSCHLVHAEGLIANMVDMVKVHQRSTMRRLSLWRSGAVLNAPRTTVPAIVDKAA